MNRFILASASPRRSELLRQIGIEPEIMPSDIEEKITSEDPEEVVKSLSRQKATDIASKICCNYQTKPEASSSTDLDSKIVTAAGEAPGSDITNAVNENRSTSIQNTIAEDHRTIVLGADTVVSIDGRILGKPHSHEEAREMISHLQGRAHQVYTGVTIIVAEGQKMVDIETFAVKTDVHVYTMSEHEIQNYAYSEEPMDKAGAYGIQGYFARYIRGISGDYNNVVGLPVSEVYHRIKHLI